MISFEKAFEIVMSRVRVLEPEQVELCAALNRILAEDVQSDLDMPAFDKSAMDGYACRSEDLPGPLRVLETIQAGSVPAMEVGRGECSKIMTGAMMPKGADCVILIEHTQPAGERAIRFTAKATDPNIRHKGEDVRAGDVVLRRGTRLRPQHIAVLAASGRVRPSVSKRPRVGVIATGDELVEPHESPGPSQIRTSNSCQICAHVESADAAATYYGIMPDSEPAIDTALKRAMAENDVVVLSGGVSMGDFDLVPAVMKKNHIEKIGRASCRERV
jgi:molybdopterin molybdotransferase